MCEPPEFGSLSSHVLISLCMGKSTGPPHQSLMTEIAHISQARTCSISISLTFPRNLSVCILEVVTCIFRSATFAIFYHSKQKESYKPRMGMALAVLWNHWNALICLSSTGIRGSPKRFFLCLLPNEENERFCKTTTQGTHLRHTHI